MRHDRPPNDTEYARSAHGGSNDDTTQRKSANTVDVDGAFSRDQFSALTQVPARTSVAKW
jgi:hypothetical protein